MFSDNSDTLGNLLFLAVTSITGMIEKADNLIEWEQTMHICILLTKIGTITYHAAKGSLCMLHSHNLKKYSTKQKTQLSMM